MYDLHLHKSAVKSLQKAPIKIRKKAFAFLEHLRESGTQSPPCTIKPLQGSYKKYKYLEALIDKDYRIIFRREGDAFFVREAGTHNQLGTG